MNSKNTLNKDQQRKDEWLKLDDKSFSYHEKQFKKPYRSTVAFCDWLEKTDLIDINSSQRILDLGCGGGANLYYMAQKYPRSEFVGVDINDSLVNLGNQYFEENGITNCHLEQGDFFKQYNKYSNKFDTVLSFQVMSWLPDYKDFLRIISEISPNYFALSSLFYEGLISCNNKVTEYLSASEKKRDEYYNIYSLPLVDNYVQSLGYEKIQYMRFDLDIDLPKPKDNMLGTYTEKLSTGLRLQISGPMLMPWYFISSIHSK